MKITHEIEIELIGEEPAQQDALQQFERFPILKQAAALVAVTKDGGYQTSKLNHGNGKINGHLVGNVARLIGNVNPNFPGDSFSVQTLAAMLADPSLIPDYEEELMVLNGTLPQYSGDRKMVVSVSGKQTVVLFQHSMKHSGRFYEVEFAGEHGLCFPITITMRVWSDMDDLANHGDYCPMCYDEESEEYSDDCNCEADIENVVTMTVTEDFNADEVANFLEAGLFPVEA